MSFNNKQLEDLRLILENCLQPRLLDAHPWTGSLIAFQAAEDMPVLLEKSPGQCLVFAVSKIFTQMMPTTPPRQGKRLDTRWGEFGILSALYFAPLCFGESTPSSLRDAWGRIDRSILLFATGKLEEQLSDIEKENYKLVGNEREIAPNSTLSDWHKKGLERLLEIVLRRERYLSSTLSKPAGIMQSSPTTGNASIVEGGRKAKPLPSSIWRFVILTLFIFFLVGITVGGFKAWAIYKQAKLVKQDAVQLRELVNAPSSKIERLRAAGPLLSTLKLDFATLKSQTEPFLWMGPSFSWVPVYGGELSSIQDLEIMAESLLSSADLTFQAVAPLLDGNSLSSITPPRLAEVLLQSQPKLIEAQQQIYDAASARSRLTPENLTPEIRDLIVNDVDLLIPLMKDGLSVAEEFPLLMGVSSEGPKTYLILVENEDELRPTGGLVAAVGTMLIQNGRISALSFEDEDEAVNPLVDWSKPYPAAPWQLQQYMNSRVMLLRDTSWFTNYPTAALYAETLYSYVKGHSVDGVIAFDQQMLVEILKGTGPITLSGVSTPINASNVITYMRSAKTPTAADLASPNRNNEIFIKLIADAVIGKIFNGDIQPETLFTVLLKALNEHHLLLQLDSLSMTAILADQHWNGAVHPEGGDFLMAVDTNVGFNKTNAVVSSNLVYDVDLTKPTSPIGSLTIFHKNDAAGIICQQWGKIRLPGEEYYPITDCYWNYLRIYLASGTKLLDSTPQFVPANWMIVKQDIPARVDSLDEGITGVQAFGTLQVVPGGETVVTSFQFALPASIIKPQPGSGAWVYHLFVQKQPGTSAVPITIRVHLPNRASIQTVPEGAVDQENNIVFQSDLRTDLDFEVVFTTP
jgi:Protein of unknown function (DUF4012)